MTWGDVQQYVQVLWVDPTTGLERLALTWRSPALPSRFRDRLDRAEWDCRFPL